MNGCIVISVTNSPTLCVVWDEVPLNKFLDTRSWIVLVLVKFVISTPPAPLLPTLLWSCLVLSCTFRTSRSASVNESIWFNWSNKELNGVPKSISKLIAASGGFLTSVYPS